MLVYGAAVPMEVLTVSTTLSRAAYNPSKTGICEACESSVR